MYDTTLGRFLERDPSRAVASPNRYPYGDDSPTSTLDPTGLAPAAAEKVVQDWTKQKRFFRATVKRWCGNCFKVRIDIEYEEQLLERNGKQFSKWRNLRYTSYELGEKVPCTGKEIGELAAPGKWSAFSPPWQVSGEEPVPAAKPQPNAQGTPANGGFRVMSFFDVFVDIEMPGGAGALPAPQKPPGTKPSEPTPPNGK
jgi:hypothetical protein